MSIDYAYCHDDVDPNLPYIGPFDSEDGRVWLQPRGPIWVVYWSGSSARGLFAAANLAVEQSRLRHTTLQIENVPPEFEAELLKSGFTPAGELVEAWMENLQAAHPALKHNYPARNMLYSEIMIAAHIMKSCKFYGEDPAWIEAWGANPNQKVFLGMDGDRPVGVLFAGLYGFDHPKGTVCWIRELAVLPSFQNRGVGRELLLTALQWGIIHGAKRAYLKVDVQKEYALRLYKKVGFLLRPGRGQINLQWVLP